MPSCDAARAAARLAVAGALAVALSALGPCGGGVRAAGWCDGIERGEGCGAAYELGPEALELHLRDGEQPRDSVWGAGLIETVIDDVDVLVAGGGSAGVSAALAAARSGAKTVLVHARPVLGGNAGSEVRLAMVGACGPRAGSGDSNQDKLECREGGIVEEYQLDNTVNNPRRVPELFSLELLTLCKAEPLLTVFLNTYFVGVGMTNATDSAAAPPSIAEALCENQDSQRRFRVRAKTYIDATGDGRLGVEAGAEWIQGREAQATYNESLAGVSSQKPDAGADHETEGTSLDFMAADSGAPATFRPPFWAAKYGKAQFQYRGVDGTRPYGYWWNEISWPYNTITDGENVTQEALADLLGIWDYVKNSGDHPDSSHMALTWFGNVGCKREGRRFVGQYVVSQNDVMAVPGGLVSPPQEPTLFWDRVAYSGWPFDLHNPKGMRDPAHPPFVSYKTPYMFSTPLRSLVAKDVGNLFFAGRLASFSHVVYGSERVMKTCAVMGQAAGTAAAYATSHGLAPIELQAHPEAVWSIQQQLLRDDALIIGLVNEDPRDHARNATATASSERTDINGSAANVLTGQARPVVASDGVPASQGVAGPNKWISQGLPASLSLELAAPAAISQVQLSFDTGMHRKLTFSVIYDTNNPASPWSPQPETVRDYVIEGKDTSTGEWVLLCNVSGNYQRRAVHNLPCPPPSPTPPPPVPATVARGAVSATMCDPASPSQNWTITPSGTTATISAVVNGTRLCLGYDAKVPAFGGHGNAVVALPCAETGRLLPPRGSAGAAAALSSGVATEWQWDGAAGTKAFISLPAAVPCVDYAGNCQCAHAVACAACHTTTTGQDAYAPPTSVELWACQAASTHIEWASLSFNGGSASPAAGSAPSGLLMADGLCLEAPKTWNATAVAALPPDAVLEQRVSGPVDVDAVRARAATVPTVTDVRVTVTKTNGAPDARVSEIRLYDAAAALAPFPAQPASV